MDRRNPVAMDGIRNHSFQRGELNNYTNWSKTALAVFTGNS